MSEENSLYIIYVDNTKFYLTKNTINKSPLLSKIINGVQTNNLIVLDKQNLYIDKDARSFSFVVDVMRGYKFDINNIMDQYLKYKIKDDLNFFGLIETLNLDLDPSTILKNTNEKYDDDDLPLIKQFSNLGLKEGGFSSNVQELNEIKDLNSNILGTNNLEGINNYIQNVSNKLKSGSENQIGFIHDLSNDPNIKKLIQDSFKNNNNDEIEFEVDDIDPKFFDEDTNQSSSKNETQNQLSESKTKTSESRIKTNYIKIN